MTSPKETFTKLHQICIAFFALLSNTLAGLPNNIKAQPGAGDGSRTYDLLITNQEII